MEEFNGHSTVLRALGTEPITPKLKLIAAEFYFEVQFPKSFQDSEPMSHSKFLQMGPQLGRVFYWKLVKPRTSLGLGGAALICRQHPLLLLQLNIGEAGLIVAHRADAFLQGHGMMPLPVRH